MGRMEKIDLAILFEKAVRELDVACALKSLLERAGLRVEIFQNGNEYRRALKFRPEVVALPFCYQERSNNLYLNHWRRAKFFNLSWEQLFYPGNAIAKTPRGRFAVKNVIHHAWSEYYAELLRHQGVPEEHIFMNGNPALALYQEPYRQYFRSKEELAQTCGLNPSRQWVFFPENYNWAFYGEGMLRQMVTDGQSREDVERMRVFVRRSFELAMDWCRSLCEQGEVELILRPRPSTTPDDFRDGVTGVLGSMPPSMHILAEGTVREWVMAANAVISSYSTTLIEAAVAGKPVAMVEPEPWPPVLSQPWHELLPHLTDKKSFLRFCHDPAVESSHALGDWARERMLAHGDPIRNLALRLLQVRRGETPCPPMPPRKDVTLTEIAGLPWSAQYLLRQLRWKIHMMRPPRRIAAEYRQDMESVREIPAKVNAWNGLLAPL